MISSSVFRFAIIYGWVEPSLVIYFLIRELMQSVAISPILLPVINEALSKPTKFNLSFLPPSRNNLWTSGFVAYRIKLRIYAWAAGSDKNSLKIFWMSLSKILKSSRNLNTSLNVFSIILDSSSATVLYVWSSVILLSLF